MLRCIRFYFSRAWLYRPTWIGLIRFISVLWVGVAFFADPVPTSQLFVLCCVIAVVSLFFEMKIMLRMKRDFECFHKGTQTEGVVLQVLDEKKRFWGMAGARTVYIYKFETLTGETIAARILSKVVDPTRLLKAGEAITVYYDLHNPRHCVARLL